LDYLWLRPPIHSIQESLKNYGLSQGPHFAMPGWLTWISHYPLNWSRCSQRMNANGLSGFISTCIAIDLPAAAVPCAKFLQLTWEQIRG
jgi:hypothetical protein